MSEAAPAPPISTEAIKAASEESNAWPFEEARRLRKRLDSLPEPPREALFATGYGPSGLPHIGTFGEVARTEMVRHAYRTLTGDTVPTRLICFSDDMDGLRKVPDNVPARDMVAEHLGKPLTAIPDPFGTHESFGAHNNARLRSFLDRFGFHYEFASATEYYRSGRFDAVLMQMLAVYDEVMEIILPTLGEERQATYSPFLPISPVDGSVLQVPIVERNVDAGTIVFRDPANGELTELPVTGGHVKCQWKADWALRWTALRVDYEMSGKDLIDSVKLSSRICRALGGTPPEGFSYELFLDEAGQKISKSRGNGLTIDEWLAYASPESLSLYMFQKPKAAKRLYFDVIPKAVDEYFTFLAKYPDEAPGAQVENPVFHIHSGHPPGDVPPVSFAMLLNLVSASNAEDRAALWGFISRYAPDVTPETSPALDEMVGYALRYYRDFILATKRFRAPTDVEAEALRELSSRLDALPTDADQEAIQSEVYAIGKSLPFENLRDWFKALYQVLLGQDQGPRFGSFVEIYGIAETKRLIDDALAGRLVAETAA